MIILKRKNKLIILFFIFMQYDMKKLERMTLEELKETAKTLGLRVRNTKNPQLLIYEILDAQADQKAKEIQAKEEARTERKRERVRVKQPQPAQKVSTDNLKAEKVIATVGSEKEQVKEMQEQLRQNNHTPNKTVQKVQSVKFAPAPAPAAEPQETVAQPVAAQEQPIAQEQPTTP